MLFSNILVQIHISFIHSYYLIIGIRSETVFSAVSERGPLECHCLDSHRRERMALFLPSLSIINTSEFICGGYMWRGKFSITDSIIEF